MCWDVRERSIVGINKRLETLLRCGEHVGVNVAVVGWW